MSKGIRLIFHCFFLLIVTCGFSITPEPACAGCESVYQRIITITDNHQDNPAWPGPLAYGPGNPTAVDRGASVLVTVSEGVSPYVWELSGGSGFSMQATGQANVIELSASSNACGVAVVNIKDAAGASVGGSVECSAGEWILVEEIDSHAWDDAFVAENVVGERKYIEDWCTEPCDKNCLGGPLEPHTEPQANCWLESARIYEKRCN